MPDNDDDDESEKMLLPPSEHKALNTAAYHDVAAPTLSDFTYCQRLRNIQHSQLEAIREHKRPSRMELPPDR